jgi:hypothetical protein
MVLGQTLLWVGHCGEFVAPSCRWINKLRPFAYTSVGETMLWSLEDLPGRQSAQST